MSHPTKIGTTIPGIVALVFVIAISVPAKFGAMSIWLPKNPANMPPTDVMAIVINNTASHLVQPT